MKIGFDAKRAFLNHSGLGNYCRHFISGLHELFPNEEYYLYTPKVSDKYSLPGNIITPPWYYKGPLKSYWRTYKIPESLNKMSLQIYHGLSNELPVGIDQFKGGKVVSFHDVIFLRYPELYKPVDVKIYTAKWKYAVKHADLIITNSTQTSSDIIQYFNANPSIVHNLGVDCLPVFHKNLLADEVASVTKKYGLLSPYIISVGTIEKRKDQLTALKAWHLSGRYKEVHFVFVGRPTDYKNEMDQYIQANQLAPFVHFLSVRSNEDLAALYKGSLFSVYISTFEGFGIPIVESMNQGVPVIISDSSCLPETAGDAGLMAKTGEVEDVKSKMLQLMNDAFLRKELSVAGILQAKKFRKEYSIPELMRLYKKLE